MEVYSWGCGEYGEPTDVKFGTEFNFLLLLFLVKAVFKSLVIFAVLCSRDQTAETHRKWSYRVPLAYPRK